LAISAVLESGLFLTGALSANPEHRGRVLLAWSLSEIPHAIFVALAVAAGLGTFALIAALYGSSAGAQAANGDGFLGASLALLTGAIMGGTAGAAALVLAEAGGTLSRAVIYSVLRVVGDSAAASGGGG